jgi:hypothetical protein
MPVSAQGLYSVSAPAQVAIIGDGRQNLAVASMLAASGHSVRLWSIDGNVPAECEVRERNARIGQVRSRIDFAVVSDKLEDILKSSPLLFLSVPASEYSASIAGLNSYLANGQTIVLVDAPLGAALQFSRELGAVAPELQLNILEMGIPFDSARIEGEVALITGPRKRISICGLTRNETRRSLASVGQLWQGLVPASNVLERGFNDVERILRGSMRLFKIVEGRTFDSRSATGALSQVMLSICSAIDMEVSAVAKKLAVPFQSAAQALIDYCGASGRSFAEIVASVSAVLMPGIDGDGSQEMRDKLQREICETFVLIEELARLARCPVPITDSIIELASVATERDLRKEGRGLSTLGLVGVDVPELIEFINK